MSQLQCENAHASDEASPDQVARLLGVTREVTETYGVGSYRYFNLADAIAQARRMAKLERELL
jgi:hypothetical protein